MTDDYIRRKQDIEYYLDYERTNAGAIDNIASLYHMVIELGEAVERLKDDNEHLSAALADAARRIR